ncbi:MAG: hypothetical protein RBU37_21365 [Myxococcota bacterium]|jgi:hypothetical protein|nr:hypothetical protein [Myxococcota bacterium]
MTQGTALAKTTSTQACKTSRYALIAAVTLAVFACQHQAPSPVATDAEEDAAPSAELLLEELAFRFLDPLATEASLRDLICQEDLDVASPDALSKELAVRQKLSELVLGAVRFDATEAQAQDASETPSNTKTAAQDPDDGGKPSTARLTVRARNQDNSATLVSVLFRQQGDTWCVDTGWAAAAHARELERARRTVLEAAIASIEEASDLSVEFRYPEARRLLDQAEASLATVGNDEAAVENVRSQVAEAKAALGVLEAKWITGRWTKREDLDPMTDVRNVTASLHGKGESRAMLTLRCSRGELDAYVSSEHMLDASWRNDQVTGQHRFGSEPAEKLTGGRSTDYHAVFLSKPSAWLELLRAHDGQSWTVELPVHNRRPVTLQFELEGAAQAIALVAEACPNSK